MNPLGIPQKELKAATDAVRSSMLDTLPDEKNCDHRFSPKFEQNMAALIRRTNHRRQIIRFTRRTAAMFAVVLLGFSFWLAMDLSARAAAHNWFNWYFSNSIVYRSDAPVLDRELPRYELTRLPEGYTHTVETSSYDDLAHTRSRAIFCYNSQSDSTLVLLYGALDENTHYSLPVSQDTHTRGKVVLADTIADLYVPLDTADPHYLFWSDDDNGVFFSLKVHGDSSVILNIANSVSLVKSTN